MLHELFQGQLAFIGNRLEIPVVEDHQLEILQVNFSGITGAEHIELGAQQCGGRQCRFEGSDGVDEMRLRGMAHGRRAIKRRARCQGRLRQPGELVEGSQDLLARIVEI